MDFRNEFTDKIVEDLKKEIISEQDKRFLKAISFISGKEPMIFKEEWQNVPWEYNERPLHEELFNKKLEDKSLNRVLNMTLYSGV